MSNELTGKEPHPEALSDAPDAPKEGQTEKPKPPHPLVNRIQPRPRVFAKVEFVRDEIRRTGAVDPIQEDLQPTRRF
jgi:hypothetical protein